MRTFFELFQAYSWARDYNVNIHLAMKDIDDCSFAFLEATTREPGMYCSVKGDYMIFGKYGTEKSKDVFIHFFEDGEKLYAAMYKPDGDMYSPYCLTIPDVKKPHIFSSGYIHGKCPEHLKFWYKKIEIATTTVPIKHPTQKNMSIYIESGTSM